MDNWEDAGDQDIIAPTSIEVQDIKLFGKWNPDEVQVSDISLTVSWYCIYQSQMNYDEVWFDMWNIWNDW